MELVRQVDEYRTLTKERDSLINQQETNVKDFEREKHQSESRCCKETKDME